MNIKGVQLVVDEDGEKQAVLIDLNQNKQIGEDCYDAAIAESRRDEPRESLEEVTPKVLN